MGVWEEYYLPIIGMVSVEFVHATVLLLSRVALVNGLNPKIFVFYRLASATLVTSPIAYFSRDKSSNAPMDLKLFLLIFSSSFVGVTLFQTLYVEGLKLASSSVTSAMFNLIPVVTFLMASILGLEKMNVKKLSNIAKMVGTSLCVGGAIGMTLLRGRQLLNNTELDLLISSVTNDGNNWLVGCLLLMASVCCWSSWLILQVPITKRYPDSLSLSAWICFFSALQTGTIALFLEPHPKAWILRSRLELGTCLFVGIFGSGAQYFIQCWCISRKGPVFTSAFNPLNTVITTFFASLFLHEQVYVGTIVGGIVVITGLYVFLWGKTKEMKDKNELEELVNIMTTIDNTSVTNNVEEQLLSNNYTT